MKEYKQLGAYALILKDDKILLIKKKTGPYDGKLDLPGGTIEFGERPEEALKRELKEEVGIDVIAYELFDTEINNLKILEKDNLYDKMPRLIEEGMINDKHYIVLKK